MMTHATRLNKEFYILQIIQLKNPISKSMNNLLINLTISKIKERILKTSILKIFKFHTLIIKLPRGQNELIRGKSCLTFKRMRKNFWKLMNLRSLTNRHKIYKILMECLRNMIQIFKNLIIQWIIK